MTPALSFEIGCPTCGSALRHVTSGQPAARRTTAMMLCTGCGVDIEVAVRLTVCAGANRRYNAQPLIDWIVARNDTDIDGQAEGTDVSFVARRLGIDRNTLHYYRRHGINDRAADALTTRLNIHPVMIWPDFAADALETAS